MPNKVMYPKITVLGSGHSGHALAGAFALAGFSVNLVSLYRAHSFCSDAAQHILSYRDQSKITHRVPVQFTRDVQQSVSEADIIFCAIPAFQHQIIINRILPYMRLGQYIVFSAYFGALKFLRAIDRYPHLQKKVTVIESASAFHAARSPNFGSVEILGAKSAVPVAAYPPTKLEEFCSLVSPVLPCSIFAQNILHTSLSSVGPMLHVPLILLNAARIENIDAENWQFYAEGLTPSVEAYISRLDEERLKLCSALGLIPYPIEQIMAEFFYKDQFSSGKLFDWLRNNGVHTAQALKAPDTVHSRYLVEGVEYGLKPLLFLSNQLRSAQKRRDFMPMTQASVEIAQVLLAQKGSFVKHDMQDYLSFGVLQDILGLDNVVGM